MKYETLRKNLVKKQERLKSSLQGEYWEKRRADSEKRYLSELDKIAKQQQLVDGAVQIEIDHLDKMILHIDEITKKPEAKKEEENPPAFLKQEEPAKAETNG